MNLYIYIIFFCTFFVIQLLLNSGKVDRQISKRMGFTILAILLVITHLLAAFIYKSQVLDTYLFSDAGKYLNQKIDYYWIDSDHNKYPFFPFLIFLYGFLVWLTQLQNQLNFLFLLKVVLIIPLLNLGFWLLNNSKEKTDGKRSFLELLASPITHSIIFYHGQIDVILISFFVLSMSSLNTNSMGLVNLGLSSLYYAMSIASKTWSILFAPFIVWRDWKSTTFQFFQNMDLKSLSKFFRNLILHSWQKILFFFLTGLLLFLNVFIYTRYVDGSSISTVLPAIFKAGGPIGVWGVTIFPTLTHLITKSKIIFYAVFLLIGYFFILRKNYTFWQNITLFVLWLYIVAIHWAVQYLFWILPFGIYNKQFLGKKWWFVFTTISSLYVFMNYINISGEELLINNSVILVTGLFLWIIISWKFFKKIV